MAEFKINLDDKPYLAKLMQENTNAFRVIVGTFVKQMEIAAENNWYEVPEAIHSSITFDALVSGILNATLTTKALNREAFEVLEQDLHPLALLSDKREDPITGELENYNWRKHFALDSNDISQDTIEKIIRKILYLVRWFDIDAVSKALITSQFPIIDPKEVAKLPFQPALQYQKEHLGELHQGKFFHDIGAFNLGKIDEDMAQCPACKIGHLLEIHNYKVCPHCNGGWEIERNSIN